MFLLFRLPNVALVRKTDAVCSRMFQVRVLVFLDLDFLVETIGCFEAIFLADNSCCNCPDNLSVRIDRRSIVRAIRNCFVGTIALFWLFWGVSG